MERLEPSPHVPGSLPQSLPGLPGSRGRLLPWASPGCGLLSHHGIQLNRRPPLALAYFCATLNISKPSFPPKESLTQSYCGSHGLTKSWGNGSRQSAQMVRAAVPNFSGTGNRFCGRHFSSEREWAGTETGGGTQGVRPVQLCSFAHHSPPAV